MGIINFKILFQTIVLLFLFSNPIICTSDLKRINITGGPFLSNNYRKSYVIRAHNGMGPKMCVRECMLQHECNAVHYRELNYTCELLNWNTTDETDGETEFMFSDISKWTMDSNSCWPNPCTDKERCIIALYGNFVCVPVADGCLTNHCLNGGICRNTVDGVRCQCQANYAGELCEITPCTSGPCQNSGTCSHSNAGHTCQCMPNYNGTECQVNPCQDGICQNGATCAMDGYNYNCTCLPEYSGNNCEITPCDNNVCLNGSTCSMNGLDYDCSCLPHFSGKKCWRTPCKNDICQNGATCTMTGLSYTCSCAAGYSGVNCENATR